jgi:hypothetical protein
MDNRNIATHYLSTFYNDIQELNKYFPYYINLLMEVVNKTSVAMKDGKMEIQSIPPDMQPSFIQALQIIRGLCIKTFISYRSIEGHLKTKNENLKPLYMKFTTSNDKESGYMITHKDLENYVVIVNQILMDEVIGDLLTTSQDIVNQMFNQQPPPQNG